ncbi:VOC family protein [Demequina silvatica]|uniref:VOC family protein n=1 Tax=Demequina silvatica TaxID=1638988 RepID=UPI0007848EC4|nr:VOC family protein [Demequina silvatica]
MAIIRLDHVNINVEDLDAAIVFFERLGMTLEGRQTVEGGWVDRVVGFDGTVSEIAVLVTPDGHGRVELARFHTPAPLRPDPHPAPANALGYTNMMFAVDDVDATVADLAELGATVVREVVTYGDSYRLCYLHGPEGIIVALAQPLQE